MKSNYCESATRWGLSRKEAKPSIQTIALDSRLPGKQGHKVPVQVPNGTGQGIDPGSGLKKPGEDGTWIDRFLLMERAPGMDSLRRVEVLEAQRPGLLDAVDSFHGMEIFSRQFFPIASPVNGSCGAGTVGLV